MPGILTTIINTFEKILNKIEKSIRRNKKTPTHYLSIRLLLSKLTKKIKYLTIKDTEVIQCFPTND